MTVTLTPEQQQALDAQPGGHLQVLDPRTNETFVLVRKQEFDSAREILEDEAFQKAVAAMVRKNASKWAQENPY